VVGISPDPPAKLAKFRDAEELTFPLLSDPDRKVLAAWGAYGEADVRQDRPGRVSAGNTY
jgi:peroxiredoxin Q/BCP